MVTTIIKRDGRTAEFKQEKIAEAVEKAFQACAAMQDRAVAEEIAAKVVEKLDAGAIEGIPTGRAFRTWWKRPSSNRVSCRRRNPTSSIEPSAAACAT